MAIGDRSDGVRLRKLPGFRKMFPYLMRTRTESVIYHSQRLRIGKTLAWLDKANAAGEKKISLFHVVLAAGVRTLALRPEANRFVAGRRIYQRRTIDLSFVIKRQLNEQAAESTVKITFDPRSTIWAVRTLDYFGLLPASFIKGDALYTSAFLANLGSIGADAVFHHLYEWGNAPFFVTVGQRKKELVINERGEPEVEEVMDLKFSLDERISDGIYFTATIGLLADLIENPEKLDVPPMNLPVRSP